MPDPLGSARISRASAAAFRRYFWQPPRAHGEVIEGREVSFLELFYDLVYVVVISQAAGHLGGEVTWAGVGRFAVVCLQPGGDLSMRVRRDGCGHGLWWLANRSHHGDEDHQAATGGRLLR